MKIYLSLDEVVTIVRDHLKNMHDYRTVEGSDVVVLDDMDNCIGIEFDLE